MEFTPEELKAIRSEYAKGSTDEQFLLFVNECKSRSLRPGQHLIFQLRRTKEYDAEAGASVYVQKPYWITTISALRLIIERTGKYAGQTPPEYIYLDDKGNPSIVSDVPLPQKDSTQVPREPWAVRVGIKRRDFDQPIIGMARFEAVAGFAKAPSGGMTLSSMWAKRGPEMTAKCAEADGIRKAAPEEAGAYFLVEELKHEEEPTPQAEPVVLAAAPSAPVVPKVNQTPAEPTNEPRPGEEKPLPTLVELVVGAAKSDPALPTATAINIAAPEKPKTRKKADKIPDNGKQAHDRPDLGITDEDIANAGKPLEPFDEEANRKEAEDFAEDVSSAVPVPDRMPDEDQSKKYVARVRELVKTHGVSNGDVGKYVFGLSGKASSKELTIGNWDAAFEKLDKAAADGTLKELVKPNAQ